ncbi:putative ORfan [Saudi moumouvirus]|nr:putative ORfan [Saudi moumouvirus]
MCLSYYLYLYESLQITCRNMVCILSYLDESKNKFLTYYDNVIKYLARMIVNKDNINESLKTQKQ